MPMPINNDVITLIPATFTTIQSMHMYEKDKARVLMQERLTESFACSKRMQQESPASPLLFALYRDELDKRLRSAAASEKSDLTSLFQAGLGLLDGVGQICVFNPRKMKLLHPLFMISRSCCLPMTLIL